VLLYEKYLLKETLFYEITYNLLH